MKEFKDLRKAAFAVAFGATMGKFAAELVKAAIDVFVVGSVKGAAKEGSKIAQEVCEKSGLKIEPEETKDNSVS